MPYAVLIADDHAIVRRGVRAILEDLPDVRVVVEAEDGDGVVDAVRRSVALDAAILDLSMPGLTGLDLIRVVLTERPGLPILVLSMHPADQYAVRVLRAGASGYLTKESIPDRLHEALRRVLSGRRYVTPEVAELLLDAPMGEVPPHALLSDREFEVLRALASGETAQALADRLALSVKTVSTYRGRVLAKLGLRTTADLVRYAVERGLVNGSPALRWGKP